MEIYLPNHVIDLLTPDQFVLLNVLLFVHYDLEHKQGHFLGIPPLHRKVYVYRLNMPRPLKKPLKALKNRLLS